MCLEGVWKVSGRCLNVMTTLTKLLCLLVASFSKSGRKGVLSDVKEDDAIVILACDDNAHVLFTHSIFFKIK